MKCSSCKGEIHPLRLKVVPTTTLCEKCVDNNSVKRVRGHAIISGKNTYSEIQLVSEEQANLLYGLGKRNGHVSTGAKSGKTV